MNKIGINRDKPIIKVRHSELERSNHSMYRSNCTKCESGILLVHRDLETGELSELDNCLFCGQKYQYEDIKGRFI